MRRRVRGLHDSHVREFDYTGLVNHGYAYSWLLAPRRLAQFQTPVNGLDISAQQLQEASLSALGDMFAVVVPTEGAIPD